MSVVPNFTPYTEVTLTLFDHGPDVDLSQAWSTIEYEEGIPQNVKITLNAKFGEFLTRGTIIQKYGRIYVEIVDARNQLLRDVFHVRRIKRSRKAGKNQQIILFCPHQSENLWKKTISLVARRTSGFDALNQVMAQLDEPGNQGTNDPIVEVPAQDTILKVGNFLDPNTANDYIFESVKLETATDEIARIESEPVEGGGSEEPIYIRFKSKYNPITGLDLDTVQVQAFPQGVRDGGGNTFTNIPLVTLEHSPLEVANPTPEDTNILENDCT